jgi:Cu+-exporting ATPase
MAIDPICGMEVDESKALSAERDGRKYYFCCEHCRRKFVEGQESRVESQKPTFAHDARLPMLSSSAALIPRFSLLAPRSSPHAALYTCPMHPEIEQDRPGTCPICGMALEPKTATLEPEDDSELRDMTRRFWVAAALTVPLLLLAMLPMFGVPLNRWLSPRAGQWLQLVLATPAILWAGWPLVVRGVRSVVSRHLNMFTLIALGVSAAFLYSLLAVLIPGAIPEAFKEHGHAPVYFEAAATIVTLVLLGQVLELRARRRTGSAIRELLALSPPVARRIRDGKETIVPVDQLNPGDILKVVPGDRVPVDGEITTGRSTLDESMITGEPTPVLKTAGDTVIGGTVNQTGSFEFRAMRVGADTVLAQIVGLVADAQRSRAPIQRVADRVSAWFVPAVVAVAVVTFIAWALWSPVEPRLAYALMNAVAVLIIACPCALGLATPMSIMVGIGRGAKEGVLIKDAAVLEVMEKIDTLVIDKTGTLTEGRPRLTDIVPADGLADAELLRLAAAVEQNSEHPLAHSVVAASKERGIALPPVIEFDSVTGRGALGRVDGQLVHVGNAKFLRELGIAKFAGLEDRAEQLQREGRTVIFVATDSRFVGLLAVADPIKASTPEAIRALHRLGIEIVMLTGDTAPTAKTIAEHLCIDKFEAGVDPQQKYRYVESLRARGRVVAMAGDGTNDAPALAAADAGIAMGTGTDIAIESADVMLVKGDLRGIVTAIHLSRKMMRNIRQNLFFALVYNALGVPIAAGVLVPLFGVHALLNPMIAAAAMCLSDVSVVANALRLRSAKLAPK